MRSNGPGQGCDRRRFLLRLTQSAGVLACATWAGLRTPSSAAEPIATPIEAGNAAGGQCDYSDLSATDLSFRESLEYVEQSPHGAAKDCRNCASWVPPQGTYCGGCSIMRGQVHPLGYCTSWDVA